MRRDPSESLLWSAVWLVATVISLLVVLMCVTWGLVEVLR